MFEPNFFAQQGWQCPICKRVYSPFTPYCYYCGGEGVTNTSTSTDWVEHQKEPYEEPNYTSISTGYATYTAEDIRTCVYCKHHNAAESLHCACRECINYDRWEKVNA
jgi:hypothetical protein